MVNHDWNRLAPSKLRKSTPLKASESFASFGYSTPLNILCLYPNMTLQVDVAELAGVMCEGPLYGFLIALTTMTLHMLLWKRRHSSLNVPSLVAAILMILLATTQYILDLSNIFFAFVRNDREKRIQILTDVQLPIFAARYATYFTMMLVGDAVVIYRCYIVWFCNIWVVIVPIMCSIGSGVCAYQTIWASRNVAKTSIKSQSGWGLAVFLLSLTANLISNFLIAYRIWDSDRRLSAASIRHTGNRTPIVAIIVETGMINAAYLIAWSIVLRSGNQALQIMSCISTPLIGIIFNAVIIRAGIAAEREAHTIVKSLNRTPQLQVSSRGGNPSQIDTVVELRTIREWHDDNGPIMIMEAGGQSLTEKMGDSGVVETSHSQKIAHLMTD